MYTYNNFVSIAIAGYRSMITAVVVSLSDMTFLLWTIMFLPYVLSEWQAGDYSLLAFCFHQGNTCVSEYLHHLPLSLTALVWSPDNI